MDPLIIEVALNEQETKALNPAVPYGIDECIADAVACVAAGASIIHFHARDPETGAMLVPGIAEYAEVMRAVRKVDPAVLCYPTYAGRRIYPPSMEQPPTLSIEDRFCHVEALAADAEVQMAAATIDPGAVNWSRLDPESGEIDGDRFLAVSHAEVRYVLALCERYGISPSFVVRELGHVRMSVAYHRLGLTRGPLHLNVCLGDDMLWGVPPSPEAIDQYVRVVPADIPVVWLAYIYGPSASQIYRYAVDSGGHVRTGLGDNPVAPDGTRPTNVDLVREVTKMAADAGRAVATPTAARGILGGSMDT